MDRDEITYKKVIEGLRVLAHQLINMVSRISMISQNMLIANSKAIKVNAPGVNNAVNIVELNKNLNRINNEVEKVTKLLNRIFYYAKLQNKEILFKPVNISELIKNLPILQDNPQLQNSSRSNKTFKKNIFVKADPDLLKEAINAVIENASESAAYKRKEYAGFKHGKNYKEQIIIKLRITCGKCIIEIHDNGIGINKDAHNNIFKNLYTTKTDKPGLGLYIAKWIIEAVHNGKLWFKSCYEKGSVFYIELPGGKNARE